MYKGDGKSMKRFIVIGLVAGCMLCYCMSDFDVLAETENGGTTVVEETSGSDDYDQQIRDAEKIKERAEKKVSNLKGEIKDLVKNKGNLLKYVKKVDKKMEKISGTLTGVKKQVEKARNDLRGLEENFRLSEEKQKEQYKTMKKRIKYMYENGSDSFVDVVASADSIGDLLGRSEYVEKITEYDENLFIEYSKLKEDAEKKRTRMEVQIQQITGLQQELQAEQDALKKLKKSKKNEMNKVRTAISSTDSRMKTFSAEVAKQEQKVEALLKKKQEEIAKKEAAAAAAAAKNNQNNSNNASSNTTITPSVPSSSDFNNASGLRWPLEISGRLTSNFGPRKQPIAGASTYHRGIDIGIASGTKIVAAADGEVVTATYSSSAGNFVMIYHGNSLYTVYMHCSKLAVTVGKKVKQGDVIAYAGSTGVSTASHLHFGVSVNGNYVNPLTYVKQP